MTAPTHQSPSIIEDLEKIAANGGDGLGDYIARLKGEYAGSTVFGIVQMLARLPQKLRVLINIEDDGGLTEPTLVVYDWNTGPNAEGDWDNDNPFIVFEDRDGHAHIGPFGVVKEAKAARKEERA